MHTVDPLLRTRAANHGTVASSTHTIVVQPNPPVAAYGECCALLVACPVPGTSRGPCSHRFKRPAHLHSASAAWLHTPGPASVELIPGEAVTLHANGTCFNTPCAYGWAVRTGGQ